MSDIAFKINFTDMKASKVSAWERIMKLGALLNKRPELGHMTFEKRDDDTFDGVFLLRAQGLNLLVDFLTAVEDEGECDACHI